MKAALLLVLLSVTAVCTAQAQSAAPAPRVATPDKAKEVRVVEASCGQCRLGLPGKGCDLAVRLDGNAYFVDGTTIDSHGDAHAKDGFCQAIRKAEVQGEVVENRFRATYFKLLPDQPASGK
ncbi:DUF6370 family protein [Hymenobacter glacieicola]|uniref:Glutaminyl-tRNA synthetase n=1 Tax=Hymenobacter glacieicola TaxID=1562124 RepID=A0ABQ1WZG5_9BACT|nr:DUF6370 family protein [Hymenobacter glacieicola]GGG47799.1 hypothetical protein GCM10011378_25000 [Hymenobacter glacieicola]